jgi:hypothetical protein
MGEGFKRRCIESEAGLCLGAVIFTNGTYRVCVRGGGREGGGYLWRYLLREIGFIALFADAHLLCIHLLQILSPCKADGNVIVLFSCQIAAGNAVQRSV